MTIMSFIAVRVRDPWRKCNPSTIFYIYILLFIVHKKRWLIFSVWSLRAIQCFCTRIERQHHVKLSNNIGNHTPHEISNADGFDYWTTTHYTNQILWRIIFPWAHGWTFIISLSTNHILLASRTTPDIQQILKESAQDPAAEGVIFDRLKYHGSRRIMNAKSAYEYGQSNGNFW